MTTAVDASVDIQDDLTISSGRAIGPPFWLRFLSFFPRVGVGGGGPLEGGGGTRRVKENKGLGKSHKIKFLDFFLGLPGGGEGEGFGEVGEVT